MWSKQALVCLQQCLLTCLAVCGCVLVSGVYTGLTDCADTQMLVNVITQRLQYSKLLLMHYCQLAASITAQD